MLEFKLMEIGYYVSLRLQEWSIYLYVDKRTEATCAYTIMYTSRVTVYNTMMMQVTVDYC